MNIDWIEPGILAASGIPLAAKDITALHHQRIRAVVSLTEHPLTGVGEITPDLFKRLDILYHHAPIRDHWVPDLAQAWEILRYLERMKDQHRAVLVHCHAGSGRTGTILHLYYLAQGIGLEEAKQRVRSRRLACDFRHLTDSQQAFIEHFAARCADKN